MSFRALAVVLTVATATGCTPTHAESVEPVRPQVVRVAEVTEADVSRSLTLQGVTRAADRARLGIPMGGRLDARPVRVGDRVEKGQVLARLDSEPWRNAVSAQSARVVELDERIGQLDRELARLVRLDAKGSVVAAERERVQADRDAAEALSTSLSAQLRESQRQLADSVLTAPFAGVVVAIHAEPGETIAAGAPVVELAGEGIEVAVEVPESAWVRLSRDTRARVRLPALDVETPADVIDLAAAGGGRGGLFPVVVAIPDGERRVAGLTAEVRLEMPVQTGLVAPVRAIVDPTGEDPGVFVIEGDHVTRASIEVGALHGDGVVVSGLDAGTPVVVAGHAQLFDGQQVEVRRD